MVTRRIDHRVEPIHLAQGVLIVALYATWPLVQVDLPLILAASQLEERHRLSFGAALVVEAARRAGASCLVTEDLQGGRLTGGRIENPFL